MNTWKQRIRRGPIHASQIPFGFETSPCPDCGIKTQHLDGIRFSFSAQEGPVDIIPTAELHECWQQQQRRDEAELELQQWWAQQDADDIQDQEQRWGEERE